MFLVLTCFGLHPVATLVYQSVNRLLSQISPRLRSDKAVLGDKVPHKTTRWFCDFPVAVFSSLQEVYARNGYMRIQRTTFPQRACEAARRKRHRSSVPAPAIVRCPSSRPTGRATAGVQFPAPRDRTTRRAFGQHDGACVAGLCLFCHAQGNYGAAQSCQPWTTPEAIYDWR